MARNPNKGPRQQNQNPTTRTGAVSWLHQCPNWPLHEVLLSEGWENENELATVVVARQSPRSGKIAVAAFLVDLACLGVKSAFIRLCKTPDEYRRRVLRSLEEEQTLKPADLDLAAKIVTEGLAYAERLGFKPDPEYQQAQTLLAGANPQACAVQIPLGGPEGKPHFISGPYDNVEQIMETLRRTVGDGNFHFTAFVDSSYADPKPPRLFGDD